MRNVLIVGFLLAALPACGDPDPKELIQEPTKEAVDAITLDAAGAPAADAPEVVLTFRVNDLDGPIEDVARAVDHRLQSMQWGTAVVVPGEPPRIECRVPDGDQAHRFRVSALISRRGELALRGLVDGAELQAETARRRELQDAYEPRLAEWRWQPRRGSADECLIVEPLPGSERDFTERAFASAAPVELEETIVPKRMAADAPGWGVKLVVRDDRKEAFRAFTESLVGKLMAIVLDGVVEASPVVRTPAEGEYVIQAGLDGGWSKDEAQLIAICLSMRSSYRATLVLDEVVELESE